MNSEKNTAEGQETNMPPRSSSDFTPYLAKIVVVGIGGGGGNSINRMRADNLEGVDLIAINTDAQALIGNEADIKIAIGGDGLGAGGNPKVGETAAKDHTDEIQEAIKGADMVFITVGEGGGTGTGGAPVVAEIAKEMEALTIAVATRPFAFEGDQRRTIADEGLRLLRDKVDSLIVIPNEKLIEIAGEDVGLRTAFLMVDEILMQSVKGITDLITKPGLVNIDFADVKAILKDTGSALIGVGEASGEERGASAARKAISNPLLEDSIRSARGIIFNVTGGVDPELGMHEITAASEIINGVTGPGSNNIFGAMIDERLGDKIRVTVLAAGFSDPGESMPLGDALSGVEPYAPQEFDVTDDDLDLPDFLK